MKNRGGMPTAQLAAIRESKGISLYEIGENTKICVRYLRAIESGDFAQLPGGVYARNYIRQYAQAIDIDDWDLLRAYQMAIAIEDPPPPEASPNRGLFASLLRSIGARA